MQVITIQQLDDSGNVWREFKRHPRNQRERLDAFRSIERGYNLRSGRTRVLEGDFVLPIDGDELIPNPIVDQRYDAQVGGGVVRTYRDGTVCAVDGIGYSLSPGFESVAELREWWATTFAKEVK